MNCRPAAFGTTIEHVLEVTKMFANKFVSSNKWGPLSNIVIEFIEGESGAYYFSKISSFKTRGVQEFQKEWAISSKFEEYGLKDFDYLAPDCKVNLLCSNYENN